MPDPVSRFGVVDKTPNLKASAALRQVFDRLDSGFYLLHAKADIESAPPYFAFDDAAQPLFFSWLQQNEQKVLGLGSGMLAQHLNKYPKLVTALALIFHLVEIASGVTKGQSTIGVASLQLAIRFSDYLEAHARRIYSLAALAKFRSAHTLAEKIKSGELSGHITVRGVQRKGWSGLTEKEDLESAFTELEAAFWIRKVVSERTSTPGGRPPAPRYEINPKIFQISEPGSALPKPTKPTARRKRAR